MAGKPTYEELEEKIIALEKESLEHQQIAKALLESEQRVKDSEEKFKTLLEKAPIGIYYSDFVGKFLYGNKKAEEIIGYTSKELVGKNFLKLNLLDSKNVPKAIQLLTLNFLGKSTGPDEFPIRRKDGSEAILEISTVVTDLGGKKIIIGMVQDITERKDKEKQLQQTNGDLEDFFDNANALIQNVDKDGIIIRANKKWKETLGYNDEEVSFITFWDVIHPDSIEYCKDIFAKVISGEAVNDFEVRLVSKNGDAVYVEGNVNSGFVNGGTMSTRGIFRDVTERKQLDDKLKRDHENAIKANKRLEQAYVKMREHKECLDMQLRQEDICFLIDMKGIILGITDLALQTIDIHRARILSNNFYDLIDEKSQQDLKSHIENVCNGIFQEISIRFVLGEKGSHLFEGKLIRLNIKDNKVFLMLLRGQ